MGVPFADKFLLDKKVHKEKGKAPLHHNKVTLICSHYA